MHTWLTSRWNRTGQSSRRPGWRRLGTGILASALLCCFGAAVPASAASEDNAAAWYNYTGNHPFGQGNPWGATLAMQWRRNRVGIQPLQLLFQAGLFRKINPHITVSGGYIFLETYRYGAFPTTASFPEHRTYEIVSFNYGIPKNWGMVNRLWFEQRHLGEEVPNSTGTGYNVGNYRYENRFRYLLRFTHPLPWENTYGIVQSEVFFNYGKNVYKNVFDQNRAFIGVGYHFPRQMNLEVGYMEHTVQNRGGQLYQHNHTFQVTLSSTLPF